MSAKIDQEEDYAVDIFVLKTTGVKTTFHDMYLFGEIESSENYTHLLNYINCLNKNDTLRIYIDSEGGDIFTTLALLRAMRETRAHTHVIVVGQCSSSATLILLAAKTYEIEPHSMFMFHNYSGERFGKGGELYDNIVFERMWSENLLKTVYCGFLSEDEITQILNNKDIWMTRDEVVKRLNNRNVPQAREEEKESVILQLDDVQTLGCSFDANVDTLELWVDSVYG